MLKFWIVLVFAGCGWLEPTQESQAQAVGPVGLSRVAHSGSPLAGSGTQANPLTATLVTTPPLTGSGSTLYPLVYGLSPMGGYFGDGADGACNFDGVTFPVAGATSLSIPPWIFYQMNRDIQCATIVISGANTVLWVNGYRILARDNIVVNTGATTGTLSIYGGGDPAASVGVAGVGRQRGSTCAGGAGAASNASGLGGAVGTSATASGQTRCHPRTGGGTGAGGAGVNAGGATPGVGSVFTAANGDIVATAWNALGFRTPGNSSYGQTCGSGGSAGGGGGTAGSRGGSGGGGAGGIVIGTPTISFVAGSGIYGYGGVGANPLNDGVRASGGGGGGEGALVVLVTADDTAQTAPINNDGGAGGIGVNGGANGQQGAHGCQIRWSLK